MFLGCKVRRVCRADNFTAICEPVTGIALLYGDGVLPVRYELDCKYCYK
jgi:hypothetical protein